MKSDNINNMSYTRKKRTRYRRLSYLTDIRGIKSAIGELRGLGYPKQPRLNKYYVPRYDDPAFDEQWFVNAIKDKLANHPANSMEFPFEGEKIFDEPLIGFVKGDDPIFTEYKKIIGPHHFTPEEIMAWQAKSNDVPPPKPEDLSVVSFVMPITKLTKRENASMKEWPSERWAQTRLLGEIFSQVMVRDIVTFLMDHGVLAVSPDVTPMFNKKRYPVVGWASPWSHRHMAYAAGLGTFGMHDFFITEAGAAHRVGSFVVNKRLEPNRTRPTDIHAYCLHHQGVKCLKCAAKCPVNAISESGHDKEICYKKVAGTIPYCNKNYHIFIYGCGLCSTGVPCESRIPVK
jgi:epoxyqueuosine reductase QueG